MALFKITLHVWITFILTLMISGADGNGWTVNVNRQNEAHRGSDVLIQCRFTHPSGPSNDTKVFWKKNVRQDTGRQREENNPFIFHPDATKIIQLYSGRTSLVGNVHEGDCSLQIKNITHGESDLYVRVYAGDYYSFYKYPVSITLTGATTKSVTIPPDVTEKVIRTLPHVTSSTTLMYSTDSIDSAPTHSPVFPLHLVISVPVATVFIVGIVSFIVFLVYRKHGRARPLNRSSSGYYANYSRSTMNQTKSFPQDPGVKAFDDEPVYSNLQSHQPSATSEMDESIYANV